MMKKLLTLLYVLPVAFASAQEFSIKSIEQSRDALVVYYDLIDTTSSRVYTIYLYSSHDKFVAPLLKVSGDIGLEVKPGKNKMIRWNVREELGETYRGELQLEVKGRVYAPFIQFNDFKSGRVFKRGKSSTLTWSGGSRQNILNFAIYKNDKYVGVVSNVANSGTYNMVIPKDIKPGSDYYFVVSDTKNKDQMMKTETFTVKRRFPLMVKVVPVVALGAAIYSILPEKGDEELSGPPTIPANKN